MHRYRTLSRNLFLVTHSSPATVNCSENSSRQFLARSWLRAISTTCTQNANGSDSYKNISEMLNVTSNGKGDSPEEIVAEQDKIREVQSASHFSGPGGKTRSGVILGIETSADDTGKTQISE